MGRLLFDLRVAFRTVVRNRWVSAVAVVALALGIGVTTAVFSIFNGVLLAPLPYPQADRLVVGVPTRSRLATRAPPPFRNIATGASVITSSPRSEAQPAPASS